MPLAMRRRVGAASGRLQRTARAFPAARTLFVTVPARMEIWSNYDEYYGHFVRYDEATIADVAKRAGLSLRESGYFFHSLYAAARVVQPFQKDRPIVVRAPRVGAERTVHRLRARAFDWEERLVPSGSLGSSLFAVFEPRTNGV